MRQAIYLYDPTHQYRGLKQDCDEYKVLRINYLRKYQTAIIDDNLWMEKHYFQKLLTCIRYNNFSQRIVERLYSVFRQRAEWCAYCWIEFCDNLKNDELLSVEEKRCQLNETKYSFVVNDKQQYVFSHNLKDELRRLFKMYQHNGFVSEEVVRKYEEGRFLFKYSHMEHEMAEFFDANNIEATFQKTFDDLVSPAGGFLRFDGCVQKGDRMLLFECQGAQHYMPVSFFGGEDAFEKLQKYDELKKDYCRKHEIPLLCIKYDQNVSKMIRKFLDRKTYSDIIYEYAN